LTEAKRFDEARAACRPAIFGDQPPADLRIMAANVEAERGELLEAVKILRALVKDEPNYFPAWYQLADWYRTTDEHPIPAILLLPLLGLLIPIIRGMNSNASGRTFSKIEFFGIAILLITLVGGLFKYLFFRFYILNGELIVKKGWIKKPIHDHNEFAFPVLIQKYLDDRERGKVQ
jgi:hypothetical protein